MTRRNGLIVSSDDIRRAVQEYEDRNIAEPIRPTRPYRPGHTEEYFRGVPGKDVVLDYIMDPNRRESLRVQPFIERREGNGGRGYRLCYDVRLLKDREVATRVLMDGARFLDYVIDEYNIPRRRRTQ